MTDSSFEIKCPRCNSTISVASDQGGETIPCPQCQHAMVVPGMRRSSRDVTVDDLIDFDDDIVQSLPESEALPEAQADDTEKPVEEFPVEELPVNELPSDQDVSLPELTEPEAITHPDVELLEEPSDDDLDDLLPFTATDEPSEKTTEERTAAAENPDPFDVDKDASLKIEGITPKDNTISTQCPLCGSMVYGTPSQIGQQLRCYDCHSMVELRQPKKESPHSQQFSHELTFSTGDDDEYRLSDPVDKPVVDTRIDQTAKEIDYDDDEFFSNRGPQLDELPDELEGNPSDSNLAIDLDVPMQASDNEPEQIEGAEVAEVIPDDEDSGEYGLAPPDEDLLRPSLGEAGYDPSAADDDQVDVVPGPVPRPAYDEIAERSEKEMPAPPPAPPPLPPPTAPPLPPPPPSDPASKRRQRFRGGEESESTADASESSEQAVTVEPIPDGSESDVENWASTMWPWVKSSLVNLGNKEFWVRGAFCGIAIAVGYCMLIASSGFFGEGSNALQNFAGYLLRSLGLIPIFLTTCYMCIMANMLVKAQLGKTHKDLEWTEFSLSDWLSEILFVATSAGFAILPGLLFGQIVAVSTKSAVAGAFFTLATFFLLTPIFLSAAAFNDSPFALLSGKVLGTFQALQNRWIRFFCVAGILTIVGTITIGIAIHAGYGGAIVMAFFHVGLFLLYFDLVGDQTRSVIECIVAKSEAS